VTPLTRADSRSITVILLALALALAAPPSAHARLFPSVNARATPSAIARVPGLPTDEELEATGARVGAIHFDARKLFDVEAGDENTTLGRLGNRLHIQTRIATIEDQLLFRSGDLYQPKLLEESARILRETRYLRDAVIRPVAYRDGLVDIEVMTQDVWTFTPGFSFGRKGGENTSGFELEDLNFLGTGTFLGLGVKSGLDRDSKYLEYSNRQLGSSWWSLSTIYSDNSDGRLAGLVLEKPFYSLGSQNAGGVSVLDDERIDSRYDLGHVTDRYVTREKHASVHWGSSLGETAGWARRLTAGVTFDEHSFGAIEGSGPTALLPADRKLVYPWIGAEWVEDAFETARNREQIERTEDYSLGWRARGRIGFASGAFGSDRDAVVLSGSFSKGLSLTDRQSIFFTVDAGGRLERSSVVGGLLQADARYFYRQSRRRVLFMNLSATAGAHLDVDQQILLGGDNGLRGYPLRYQSGEGRWLFTAEQRFFSDWYPFQMFNVGGAVFYDMGATWGHDPLGSASQGLLRDVGFGLRLGNSRSARGNVLHFDVAVPLDGDPSLRNVQYLIETKKSF
jgi:outer membrane protein assembly factor BamA